MAVDKITRIFSRYQDELIFNQLLQPLQLGSCFFNPDTD